MKLNKSLAKSIYYLSGLSLIIFVHSFASQIKTQAQEDSYCYMINGSGRQQNLNSLCGSRRNVNIDKNANRSLDWV